MKRSKQPRGVPTRTLTIKLAGVSHPNSDGSSRQRWIELYARPGAPVDLVREPNNTHSPTGTAVAVYAERKQIGYVPEEMSAWISEYLAKGYGWVARVLQVHGGTGRKPTLGVFIECAFWKNIPRPRDPYREGYKNNIERKRAAGQAPSDWDVQGVRRQTNERFFVVVAMVIFIVSVLIAIYHRFFPHSFPKW